MNKLNDFKNTYDTFNDATIKELIYNLDYSRPQLIVRAETYNLIKDMYEIVEITFIHVIEFNFFEPKGFHNHKTVWDCNFLYSPEGYAFDFNPWMENATNLEEIRKSNFYIICKDFSFKSSS